MHLRSLSISLPPSLDNIMASMVPDPAYITCIIAISVKQDLYRLSISCPHPHCRHLPRSEVHPCLSACLSVRQAPGCGSFAIDHGVSLVGYDTSPAAKALANSTGYWILRNSWTAACALPRVSLVSPLPSS